MLVLSHELLFLSFKIVSCVPNDYSCFPPSALLRHAFVLFLYMSGFPVAQMVKNLPAVWETSVQFMGWEDPLEKGMATHSSILAWRIPWPMEPGGLLTHRVTHTHLLLLVYSSRKKKMITSSSIQEIILHTCLVNVPAVLNNNRHTQ